MNYADYYDCDICNGNHVGMSLFVSGCPFHCKGCFNQETWDYNYGKKWTPEVENKFLSLVGRDYIKRITFVGGSPLCDKNVKDVNDLIIKIREKYPEKQIWVYTGYKWEDIYDPEYYNNFKYVTFPRPPMNENEYRNNLLENIDVLIDGQFECDKKDLGLAFRGSDNQRIIDVKKSIKSGEVILWNEDDKGEY